MRPNRSECSLLCCPHGGLRLSQSRLLLLLPLLLLLLLFLLRQPLHMLLPHPILQPLGLHHWH